MRNGGVAWGLLVLGLGCGAPAAGGGGTAGGERMTAGEVPAQWTTCAAACDCAIVQASPPPCCGLPELVGVQRRFAGEAERAFGGPYQPSLTCTTSCTAPPQAAVACVARVCEVVLLDGDGEREDAVIPVAPQGGHLEQRDDGTCTHWPSHCDGAPCTAARQRVCCPEPFVPR